MYTPNRLESGCCSSTVGACEDLSTVVRFKREKRQLSYFFVSFLPLNKRDLGAYHILAKGDGDKSPLLFCQGGGLDLFKVDEQIGGTSKASEKF